VIVEGQLLRVAQAPGDDFQVRSVEVAAQHGPHVGIEEMLALLGADIQPRSPQEK